MTMRVRQTKGFNFGDFVVSMLPEHKGLLLRFDGFDQSMTRRKRWTIDGQPILENRPPPKLVCVIVHPEDKAGQRVHLSMKDTRASTPLELLAWQAE